MVGSMHVLLVGTLALGAQTTGLQVRQPQVPDSANVLVNQGKNPYAQIFRRPQRGAIPQPIPDAQNPNPNRDMQPRVVCGTVVVPVKPDSDPKMVVTRKDNGVPQPEYRIRKIAPTICNE
jgi:hypothetical protein